MTVQLISGKSIESVEEGRPLDLLQPKDPTQRRRAEEAQCARLRQPTSPTTGHSKRRGHPKGGAPLATQSSCQRPGRHGMEAAGQQHSQHRRH